MKEIFKVKNKIRDFIRKFEEIIFPILKFGWCYLVFHSVHNMFNYAELFDRKIVMLLLAVLCAMLPDGFLVFVSGVVIGVNCFTVNLEVGLSYLLLFLLMYCIYIRFFPKFAYVLFLVPICYMINMPFLAPILIAVLAGIGGALPAAFGAVLYEFSLRTREVANLLKNAGDEDEVEVLKYYIETILKNKELLMIMLVFMLTIVITAVLHKLSYPFSWYVAILVGGIANILFYKMMTGMLDLNADMSACAGGTFAGVLIAMAIQLAKGVLDYPKTQRVQFEDDDYYYYVKAVPKLDAPDRKKKKKVLPPDRRPLSQEEKARRAAQRAAAAGLGTEAGEEEMRRRPARPEENEEVRRPARPAGTEETEARRRPMRPEDGENVEARRRPMRPEDGENVEARRRPMRPEDGENVEARRRPMRPEDGENIEARRRPMRPEDGENGEARRRPMRPEDGENGEARRRPMRPEDGENGEVRRRPMRPEDGENIETRRRPMRPEDGENGEVRRRPSPNRAQIVGRRESAPDYKKKENLEDVEDEG